MIQSFKCKQTKALFNGKQPKAFASFEKAAARKLLMLDAACELEGLRSPPSNRLEALKGKRSGQYNIRINNQWRICFEFENGQAHAFEIVDDH